MEQPKATGKLTGIDDLCVKTIRLLAAEGVEKARSGHPGMPMGMAPAAYSLFTRHLRYDPAAPRWQNRDRFVLSAGHGSILLYSLLHLSGFPMTLEDLKNFRQWGSKTPGHPEYDPDLGVEVTTGPLGQGIANAVGMAVAEKFLARHFNRDGLDIVNYKIYTIAGDGCLQEGVASEACSLAGHLGLDNLVVIYDDNHITIDGDTSISFTEDRAARFKAYGWHVQVLGGDGNDLEAFDRAIARTAEVKGRPHMIQLRTHIACDSPNKHDTPEAHGSPLGAEEIALIKQSYGWPADTAFHIPAEVGEHMRNAAHRRAESHAAWRKLFAGYAQTHPDLAAQFQEAAAGKLPVDIEALLPKFQAGDSVATRQASGKVLDAVMPKLPLVMGGSADLTPSNNTRFAGAEDFHAGNYGGRYIRYGVREHAMGAIMNGISVSGMVRPYGGTFLVFSDYMRPAVRVAALSKYPTIFVFTHDSIGLGEDGPTHQPVEHIAALRVLPNLLVFRPADATETAAAWKFTIQYRGGPVAMLLTRQGLPVLDRNVLPAAENIEKGAYVLIDAEKPRVLLLATGSEVAIALEAAAALAADGVAARVVSMPCWKLFEMQDRSYRDSVLPPEIKARVAVEAAVEQGWHKWIGDNGRFVGMKSFGASAPGKICYEKFGITADAVAQAALESI